MAQSEKIYSFIRHYCLIQKVLMSGNQTPKEHENMVFYMSILESF